MKISGTHTLSVPPDRAYALLLDPAVLAKTIPGCESLEKIGDSGQGAQIDEYRMNMKMAMASVSGAFEGKVRISDKNPPSSFQMVVEGAGKIGFVKGSGVLTLTAEGDGTSVAYEGEVQVGGTIAAVGQRLIDTTSKMMIKKFFERLEAA